MDVRALKHRARMLEWQDRISDCRGSGGTVRAWCDEHGIKPKTYYYWEKKVLQEATGSGEHVRTDTEAVSLIRVQPERLRSGEGLKTAGIIIRYGSVEIEYPLSASADSIAELVSALNRHV